LPRRAKRYQQSNGANEDDCDQQRQGARIDHSADLLAREDGVSESAWMAAAVVEKIGSLSTAAFFQKRGARGSARRGLSILRRAGTQPPRPGDKRP
jgi:hypothetical protein